MKIAAILTTLALAVGAGGTASAQPPVWTDNGRPDIRDNYRDMHRDPMWVRLSPSLPSYRQVQEIAVNPRRGPYQSVRISAEHGMLRVNRVTIRFANGGVRSFDYNTVLRAGQSLYIDLPGIKSTPRKIVVHTGARYAERHPNGRFAVYAARKGPQYGYWRERRYPVDRF